MLNNAQTPDAEALPPGQTFTPRQVRILKISIAIMSVLMVLGFLLLFYGVYLTATKIGKAPAGAPAAPVAGAGAAPSLPIAVAPGAEVSAMAVDQGRLILHLKRDGKSEFSVIDLASGREIQRVTLEPR